MVEQQLQFDELSPLLAALCDGTIEPASLARLEQLLTSNPAARQWYIAYLDLHGELCWGRLRDKQRGGEETAEKTVCDPQWATGGSQQVRMPKAEMAKSEPATPAPLAPRVAPLFAFHSLSVGGLLCYAIAAVILAGGVFLARAWDSGNHESSPIVQGNSRPVPGLVGRQKASEKPAVGKITGVNNCQWADARGATTVGATVPLGREYVLTSGLLEITYDIGAKVILQGPARFQVDAFDGGFLWLGKLTARVETRGDGSRQEREGKGVGAPEVLGKGNSLGHRPLFGPDAPIRIVKNPLFAIRTSQPWAPNAMLSDRGGEFSMSVDKEGMTGYVLHDPVWLHVAGAESLRTVYLNDRSLAVGVDAKGEAWVGVGSAQPPAIMREMPREVQSASGAKKQDNGT